MKPAKKIAALVLALLLAAALPFTALAEGDTAPPSGGDAPCTEHLMHDEACGYREEEALCTFAHAHDGTCDWAEAAEAADCTFAHPHDNTCGYDEATETPCAVEAGHQHTDDDGACGYREESPAVPCAVEADHLHTDNDGSCGWAEAVEAAPCQHSCEVCAPAGGAMLPLMLPTNLPGSSAQNPATTYVELAAAVDAANQNPDADTIYLGAGTFTFADEVRLSENVALIGAGADQTILVAAAGKCHFLVDGNTSAASFEGLCLRGPDGITSDSVNGGVQSNATMALTFKSCTLENNVNDEASASGGAVYTYGSVTMENCTLSGNRVGKADIPVADGGAIFAGGDVTLTNCTLVGNSATQHGGAIHSNSNVSLTCCTVAGNSAGAEAGGVNAVGALTLNGSLVSGNSGGCEVYAGAAHSGDGTVTVGGTYGEYYIVGVPADGLAALLQTDANGAPALATNGGPTQTVRPAVGGLASGGIPQGTAWRPAADQRGAGRNAQGVSDIGAADLSAALQPLVVTNYDITIESPGSLPDIIKKANAQGGGTITFDVDDDNGYAVFWLPKALPEITCPDLTIDGSKYTKVEFYLMTDGFRHFNSTGSLTLNNLLLEGYGSGFTGGVQAWGTVSLAGTEVRNCSTADNGGGIYAGGNVTLVGSTITNCSASGSGGGIYAGNDAKLTGSTVQNCSTNASGGGMYAGNEAEAREGSMVQNCSATNGGGLYTQKTAIVFQSTVQNCHASIDGGGTASLEIYLTSSTIANCSAGGNGGGAILFYYLAPTTVYYVVKISSSTITSCTATGAGGGVCALSETWLIIENSTFSYNTAKIASAISASCETSPYSAISRSTFVGNTGGSAATSYTILAADKVPFTQCTIVQNSGETAPLGTSGPVKGCLIAGNTGTDVPHFTPSRPGALASEYGENNIIGLPPGGTLGNLVQTDASGKVILTANGGRPATARPTVGGPAHNVLAAAYTNNDQRDIPCPQGAGAEVGAMELTDIDYATSQGGIITNTAQSENFTVQGTNPNNVASPAVTIQGNGIAAGTPVGAEDAVITQGSVVVSLRREWLQTLPDGQYTLTLHLLDGTATLPLTVNRNAASGNPTTPTASPQTGDGSHMGLWVALLATSLAALCAGVVLWRRRRNKHTETT